MKCGYCPESAVAWIEWPTIRRPKGAMVCAQHLAEWQQRDQRRDHPGLTIEYLEVSR